MRFLRFLQIAALITLAAGAQPAFSAFWQWSKTAATNAGADPSINWAEGMSPSSVNDSARAMMARAAEWRDDISGSITTAGTATAYTLTTNQGIASVPTDGQMLAFRASVTNGTSATMRVDGGTIYPLQSPAGTALPAGTIISGTPYRMQFNSANSAWVIEAIFGNPYSIPLGGLFQSTAPAAPNSNFIAPAGQCISTTTYNAYWVQQGSPASGACPGGQFAVIDFRGRVGAALDNLNGSAANRMTSAGCGVALTSAGAACTATETFQIQPTNLPPYTPSGSIAVANATNVARDPGGLGTITHTSSTPTGLIISLSGFVSTITASFTGTAQGGNSAAIPRVQPTIGIYVYLRVI